MKLAGIALTMLGCALAFVSILMPTTVNNPTGFGSPEIANLQAMHFQALVFHAGGFAFLGGIILLAGGGILEALVARPTATIETRRPADPPLGSLGEASSEESMQEGPEAHQLRVDAPSDEWPIWKILVAPLAALAVLAMLAMFVG